ncbi:hypothetical protein RCL1_006029 [Eukaryota sp. TZLM3-RCL]
MQDLSFRQVGRSVPGIVHKGTSSFPQTKPAIPSKFQTLIRNSSLPKGFNSTSTRFHDHTNDLPPPTAYQSLNKTSSAPSFSEKGYGPLASKTRRFPRRPRKHSAPFVHYDSIINKPTDRRPSSMFVKPCSTRLVPDYDEIPGVGQYDPVLPQEVKKYCCSSLKSTTQRKSLFETSDTPSPLDYNPPICSKSQLPRKVTNNLTPGFVKPVKTRRQSHSVLTLVDGGNKLETNVGVGDYDIEVKHRVDNRSSACFQKPVEKPKLGDKTEVKAPTSTTYSPNKPTRQRLVSSAPFKSSSVRFKSMPKEVPSSAYYNPTLPGRKSFLVKHESLFVS